ncbi:sugar-binding protein, partial [Pseudomonas neuropathica]
YTNNSAGVFLKRDYSGLEVGFDYKFSISIRRVNSVPAVPQVSLLVGGRTLVGPALISSQSWQSMSGIFTATGTTMSLELY